MTTCPCASCVDRRKLELSMYECLTPVIVPLEHLAEGDDRDVYQECGKCSACTKKRDRLLLVERFTAQVRGGYLIQ